ncbi:hypothetical protein ABKV19_020186 [Rosa sericea]
MIHRDQLKPGDHIYTWRKAYLYAHHGIYVGEGKVIHFTRAAVSSHSSENPCTTCGDPSRHGGGVMSCLDCFLSGDDLYLFEYGVTKALFIAKARGGTCTLASSDPSEHVLLRAKYLLKNGFGSYSLFKNNCEDFAIYCKTGLLVNSSTGLGRSGQASTAFAFVLGGLGLGGIVGYCLYRVAFDIGFRSDVSKVPVEELWDYMNKNQKK